MVKCTRSTLASDFKQIRATFARPDAACLKQQHPQLVAHALDVDHGPIAVGGDLALNRRNLKLDHIRAQMINRRLHIDPLTNLWRRLSQSSRRRAAP